jgi:hypothetical protein
MAFDARNLAVTGLNDVQVQKLEHFIIDIYSYRPGVQAKIDNLLLEAPEFVMGYVLRGYAVMTDGLSSGLSDAKGYLLKARALYEKANERERFHIEVLEAWIDGRNYERLKILENILVTWPLDLLAYRQLTGILFWTGDKARQLSAAMLALSHWTPETPGYNLTLSPLAFALAEQGHYELGERYAAQALEYNNVDLWALHALAHVYEMQGRNKDGEFTIGAVRHRLSEFNLFRGHLWWHFALFLLAQNRMDEVIDIFDRHILQEDSLFYLDMQNGASLLARLEIQGVQIGDRWERLARSAELTIGDHLIHFTIPHQAMILARSNRNQALSSLLNTSKNAFGKCHDDSARLSLVITEALCCYYEGDFHKFLDIMRPIRFEAANLGGSHAQQDLFFHILVDASLKVHDKSLAKLFLKERLSKRFAGEDDLEKVKLVGKYINDLDLSNRIRQCLIS